MQHDIVIIITEIWQCREDLVYDSETGSLIGYTESCIGAPFISDDCGTWLYTVLYNGKEGRCISYMHNSY